MADEGIRPRWAPRVPPRLIQRLYESYARGLLDEQILEDVGIRLYLRCQSIVVVRDVILKGIFPCPQCGADVERHRGQPENADDRLRCANCSWELSWLSYWSTFRHNELAYDVFVSDYIADWDRAHTAREKMLAIDRVIHRWHNDTREKRPRFGVARPAGVNLIEGNRQQVIEFLDKLTASGELPSSHATSWRTGLAESAWAHMMSQANSNSEASS